MIKINNKKIINYIITYFAIAFSGIPFFDANRYAEFYFMVFLGLIFFYQKHKIDGKLLYIIIITLLLSSIQIFIWGGRLFTIFSLLGLLVFIPYFAIRIIGPQFIKYFRDVLYLMSIISIIFWGATNFIPGFHEYTYQLAGLLMPYTPWEIQESFILYTYETAKIFDLYRNPGPFHEPGAFAVFLILGIISEILFEKKFITRKNIIFIINLLTTFSTAGYLAFFNIILFYFITSKKLLTIQKIILTLSILLVSVYSYNNLEFLKPKIEYQFTEQTTVSLLSPTAGRFLGARKALIVIYRYPLWGRGLIAKTKAELTSIESAEYGWITWISQIGLIAGILYMYYLLKTIKYYSIVNLRDKKFAYFAFLSLLFVLSGQKHTNSILFFMLFLTSIEFPIKKYNNLYLIKW